MVFAIPCSPPGGQGGWGIDGAAFTMRALCSASGSAYPSGDWSADGAQPTMATASTAANITDTVIAGTLWSSLLSSGLHERGSVIPVDAPTESFFRILPNVRYGSVAALRHRISSTAANERILVARQRYFESQNLNVCFHRKRSFRHRENY